MKLLKTSLALIVCIIVGISISVAFDSLLPYASGIVSIASIPVISASAAAEKWARRASTATQDYTNGVQNPSMDWATATKSAEDNYKTSVIAAANAGRFGKGVTAAGSEKQKKAAVEKGGARWAPGIAASQDAFATGIQKVLTVISGLTLPPRGIKGDPRNLQRVTIIANALHAMKVK